MRSGLGMSAVTSELKSQGRGCDSGWFVPPKAGATAESASALDRDEAGARGEAKSRAGTQTS